MQLLPTIIDTLRALPVWASLDVLVVISAFGAMVVARTTLWLVTRVTPSTETGIDDILLGELRLPLVVTVGLAGIYAATAGLTLAATDSTVLTATASTLLIVLWGRALVRIGRRSLATLDRDSATMDVAPILENLWSFTIVVVALFAVLTVWTIDVTPLLASAGIAGIALGFAARDTVANFFGSIALHVDDTYRVGDFIVLDTGVSGTVIDVSVRSTRILTRDDVVVTVPNAVLNATQVTNRSQPRSPTRVSVPVGVAYGSDLDTVETALLTAAADQDRLVSTPAPRARFRGFGDSALEYELLAWVDSPHNEGRVTHDLNRGVYDAFATAGIEVPFPHQEVHVHGLEATPSLAGPDPALE
ncbi:MAG: mechanosensitive ion channel family protein [Halobacteriaceae archaeon]